jgi:hypothetical protein
MKHQVSKPFPIGTWVKAKNNDALRYVTKHTNSQCFEDDGKVSGKPPSIFCHYDNYEAISIVELMDLLLKSEIHDTRST